MNRILIIAPNWIGDAVMSQPLLAHLKANHPLAQIDVLASKWVAPIYRSCIEVSHVIEANFEHKKIQWKLRKELAKKIHAHQYEVCYVLPNSLKSALIPWLAHIPYRVGYRGEMRFGLINFSLGNPNKVNRPPMAEHYLALITLLENEGRSSALDFVNPALHVSLDAKESVISKLSGQGIGQQAIYVLCPGAEYGPSKRWPTEHFAKLAQALISINPNNHLILLGSKGDRALGQDITIQAGEQKNIHNWCGDTSLDEAIAVISMSKAMVSNDSGLMHIGAALHIPQVAIFGSSDPHHTPPLSSKAKVLWLNLPCSPCHKRICPLGHLQCLKGILPEDVLNSIQLLR
jgi:heptosyltransferase-2